MFDGVIIAAPLELAEIEFEGVTKPRWEQQLFQPVFIKTMRGILNSAYFGLDTSADIPSIILTTKNADPLKHCNIQKAGNHESIVTFSSTEPLADEVFMEVFKGIVNPVLQCSWKAAYPVFTPLTRLPPTRLDEGLIYANSIEASISSMETAAFSALNAVKTIHFDLLRK